MAKRTKLSGILDTSSYGFTIGAMQMRISSEAVRELRRLIKRTVWIKGSISLQADVTSSFRIAQPRTEGEEEITYVTYFIKNQGKNIFLNATGNPTTLMAGRNDIPVLLTDKRYADNPAFNSFQYANRLLFAVLEYVPVEEGERFIWPREDRNRFETGDINISQLQIAWYCGDLEEHRDNTLKLMRSMYAGLKTNTGYALSDDLNLKTTPWKDNLNLTIECMSATNKDVSVTMYAKDLDPKMSGDKQAQQRLQSLIRFDCTFRNFFLDRKDMKTVIEVENLYHDLCEEGGYDTGFVKWLSDFVKNRIHLDYFMRLRHEKYVDGLAEMKEIARFKGKPNSPWTKQARLAEWWLNEGIERKKKDIASAVDIGAQEFSDVFKGLMDRTGINILIPRGYHAQVLDNRISLILSPEEYERVKIDYTANDVPSLRQQAKRSDEHMRVVAEAFENAGVLKIRRMHPKKLKSENFHIYKIFRGEVQ